MVGRTQTSQESLSLPGSRPHPQPPLLLPWPQGMLGGLLGSLPPQLHKHLGLAVTLPALQQLQDWVPWEERHLGVRFWGGIMMGDSTAHPPANLDGPLVMGPHQPSS